jgi:molybdopterin converting factor small subunit
MLLSVAMPRVTFTPNIQRHVACPDTVVTGATVREVLDALFTSNPRARSYVLDDQAALRRHMAIFVDGVAIQDRTGLSDPVSDSSTVAVFQALSGG